jgi:hypothetical protein
VSDATFSISWSDSSSTINLILKKPDGTFITPFYTFSDDYSEFVSGSTYQYYRISQPTLTSGVWEMHVTGGTINTSLGKNNSIQSGSAEAYTARVTANTSLTAQFYLDKQEYLTHEPIKLITTLSDSQPITNAVVTATVTPPSGTTQAINEDDWIEINGDTILDQKVLNQIQSEINEDQSTITLYDDGLHGDGVANDGVYANTFNQTWESGSYSFSIFAEGTSTTGDNFTRLAELSTYIAENPNVTISHSYLPLVINKGNLGFDSQFNGDADGWSQHSGIWNTDDNYFFTHGEIGYWSSVSHSSDFDNFDYEVQMWRYGSETNSNNIIIRGTPDPLAIDNRWDSYYSFQYTRSGSFSVWKKLPGETSIVLQDWTSSSAINPGDAWNTLRVVAIDNDLNFYINGTLIWSGTDTSLSSGMVGISMFREDDGIEDDWLFINWATLSTNPSTLSISEKVNPEQQLINIEANKILSNNEKSSK